ncbi:MAG: hypothetical protein MI924_29890, partial [Chloroflexales bacterium]|nr:hypothetical protein [Chloroflexales bacterium]
GDGAKIGQVVTKYIAWLDHLRGSLARWSAKQFGDVASVSASAGGVRQLSPSATLTKLFEQALFALGWTGKVDDDARQLAVARNNTQRLNNLFFVTRQVRMDRYNLSNAQRSAMNSRIHDPLLWDLTKNTFTAQEAFAVEAAYAYFIDQGFTVLYTQRNTGVEQLNNVPPVGVSKGPDMLATKVINGQEQFFVIEVKGGVNETMINRKRLRSRVGRVRLPQLTRDWISINAETRYLNALANAKDPAIRRAAQLIENVRLGGNYNAIIVGAGPDPKWGKVDQVFEEIVSPLDAAELQAVKIAQ